MSAFNINPFLNISGIKFLFSEYYHDDDFISRLHDKAYLFHQFTWNIEHDLYNFPWDLESKITSLNKNFNVKRNIIFCAPNQHTCDYIKSRGYRSILLNHNCLLDFGRFRVADNSEKIYGAVINSRPFWWKRVYLAEKIPNLAYLMATDWANDHTSWDGWKRMNFSFVKSNADLSEVVNILSSSNMGLILSGNTGDNQQGRFEGANFSTMEYLLCGLPVITTPNKGGRNFWLNAENSIQCEPDIESVYLAYLNVMNKIASGEFDAAAIRQRAIDEINKMRSNINNEINSILSENGITSEVKDLFFRTFWHKFVDYSKSPIDGISFLNS